MPRHRLLEVSVEQPDRAELRRLWVRHHIGAEQLQCLQRVRQARLALALPLQQRQRLAQRQSRLRAARRRRSRAAAAAAASASAVADEREGRLPPPLALALPRRHLLPSCLLDFALPRLLRLVRRRLGATRSLRRRHTCLLLLAPAPLLPRALLRLAPLRLELRLERRQRRAQLVHLCGRCLEARPEVEHLCDHLWAVDLLVVVLLLRALHEDLRPRLHLLELRVDVGQRLEPRLGLALRGCRLLEHHLRLLELCAVVRKRVRDEQEEGVCVCVRGAHPLGEVGKLGLVRGARRRAGVCHNIPRRYVSTPAVLAISCPGLEFSVQGLYG